jgi:Integron-associated effector binding protein
MSEHDVVEREEIAVQFVPVPDGLEGIRAAWDELESALGSLHGRHFWGAFYPDRDEYRACVELRDGDEPLASLASGTLPGGRYARTRLRGEPPAVYGLIGPAFDQLLQTAQHDASRPSLEHYRRFDEIDVLLPVE